MPRTVTFDLPEGYQDKDENLHKSVTMRRMTPGDRIAIAEDPRIRDLARYSHSIDLTGLRVSSETSPDGLPRAEDDMVFEGKVDPIAMFVSSAATMKLHAVIFGRIVEKLGAIEKPAWTVFLEFSDLDWKTMMGEYAKLDASAAGDQGGEVRTRRPFAPSASS